jgi:ribose transport system permease protein
MKKDLGIFILLVVLCAIVSILNPKFLSPYNLQNTARSIGMFGIFGIGLGVVIITGGIDLSVGSAFALLGVLLAMALVQAHWPWPVAVLVVMGAAIVLGCIHGFLIVNVGLQPFIVTLCGLLIYRSLARYIAHDETKGFGVSSYGMLRQLTTGKLFGVPMPFITLVIVAAIMWVVLHRSVYGRYLFAVGRNEEASRYSGINSRLVIASSYVLCMVLTGISGIILAMDTNSISASDFGLAYELYGIAAAVLGGCSLRGGEGSILGIVIGTALLQVLQNIVNLLGIPSSLNYGVVGAVILAGVLVDQILSRRRKSRIKASVDTSSFPVEPVESQPAQ